LRSLPIDSVVVGTDGSTAAIEQARTLLGLAYPRTIGPQTMSEIRSGQSKEIDSYQRLADIVILTSLPIAGCSLAVGVAGGLIERKRPFSLLRLTGSSLGMLRSVVTLETAGPLLISSVVSVGAGSLAAALFLHAQLKETLQPPGPAYYVIVFAGLLASFAVIASTLPLLKRMTGPETARNE
jgi:predicted lysophospholipase L1 biosynthesis ABC-type transport system permease subunit